MRPLILLALVAAVLAATAGPARAQYDNTDRYGIVRGALATAAPHGNARARGLAAVAFDTATAPLAFTNYDTPSQRAFGPLAAASLIWGPRAGGLGNATFGNSAIGTPCTIGGRNYGTVQDLRFYWAMVANAPAYLACATNTHRMYEERLAAIRNCGNQCFVDLASLYDGPSGISAVRGPLIGAIQGWLAGKPADARLVIRVTIGFPTLGQSPNEVAFFEPVVRAGAGKVELFCVSFHSGASAVGTWSHAKLFAVHDVGARRYSALIGGQNHWSAYDTSLRPPFDTNTLIAGVGGSLPSLQMDAAVEWFQADRPNDWVVRSARYVDDRLVVGFFRLDQPGQGNALFRRFSGLTGTNPGAAGGGLANAGQRAIVSLIDMGAYSNRHVGRTIARTLSDLIAAEPHTGHIRVFNQALCRPAAFGFGGLCNVRSRLTPVGRLVERSLRSALNGWGDNVWVLTSDSQISNDGYPSPYAWSVRASLFWTGERIACADEDAITFRNEWRGLRTFNNPGGRGTCGQAVRRALRSRFHWRMTTAFINGFAARQPVGVHHKLVMFGREAMFQGSFNLYPSTTAVTMPYDSKLVENGAILFDPGYVNAQATAFDEAWDLALHMMGGE